MTRLQRTPLPPPVSLAGDGSLPVVLAVAHAGRDYPHWLLAQARGGRSALEALEDPLVDRLAAQASREAVATVVARAPRAAIDCNRAEADIDPTHVRGTRPVRVSARAQSGLGLVPSRTAASGRLWHEPIDFLELERRLDEAHRPFHQAVASALRDTIARFGCALLLDCHSMPPLAGDPGIIFGDRHGRTAAGWVPAEALAIARRAGFAAGTNHPFAGGHTIAHHAAPALGIHAIQVEIDRRLYLTGSGHGLSHHAERVSILIRQLAHCLGSQLLQGQFPAAAE